MDSETSMGRQMGLFGASWTVKAAHTRIRQPPGGFGIHGQLSPVLAS